MTLERLEDRRLLAVTITEFSGPSAGTNPSSIISGSDGSLWFTEESGNAIGKVTLPGPLGPLAPTTTEFHLPNSNSFPFGITRGNDGNVWFTEGKSAVGKITPSGAITEYFLSNASPTAITQGPDGSFWILDQRNNAVDVMSIQGVLLLSYPIPTPSSRPFDITAGPDGNLWFTESQGNKIGRISTSGVMDEFAVPTGFSTPQFITSGADGCVWFAEQGVNQIGRITPSGKITEFAIPSGKTPLGIALGPDHNVWFTAIDMVSHTSEIGSITPAGNVSDYPLSTPNTVPFDITAGPDSNLWFTDTVTSKIGQAVLPGASLPPTDLTLTAVATPNPVKKGGLVTYTFTVKNNGSATAKKVALYNPIPANTAFDTSAGAVVQTSKGTAGVSDGEAIVTIGDMASGATATVTLKLAVTGAGGLVSRAYALSDSPDSKLSDNTAQVITTAILPPPTTDVAMQGVFATDAAPLLTNPTTMPVGTLLTYTLTVKNNGPADAVNLAVNDPLPAGLKVVSVDSSADSAGFHYTLSEKTVNGAVQDTIDCTLPNIASHGTPITIHIHAYPNQSGTIAASTASVTTDSSPLNPADKTFLPGFKVTTADPTPGHWQVNVKTTGPTSSGIPVSYSDGTVTIEIDPHASKAIETLAPTVTLGFVNGLQVVLSNKGQPSLGDKFIYTQNIGKTSWPAGLPGEPNNVTITVTGKDQFGKPLATYKAVGFGIISTTASAASIPVLRISNTTSGFPTLGKSRDAYGSFGTVNLHAGDDYTFDVASTIPNGNSSSAIETRIASQRPSALQLTNHLNILSLTDISTSASNPNAGVLHGEFKPTAADAGHSYLVTFGAINLKTQESTTGTITFHVLPDATTKIPTLNLTVTPETFSVPAGHTGTVDLHIHSDSPLAMPAVTVYSPLSQTPLAMPMHVYVDTNADGSVDFFNYDAIVTFSGDRSLNPLGVYDFSVHAQALGNPSSTYAIGDVYAYNGKPDEAPALPAQVLAPAQGQANPGAGDLNVAANAIDGGTKVTGFIAGSRVVLGTLDNQISTTVIPTQTGVAFVDAAGHVIAQGTANSVSYGGKTLTVGGLANNVAVLNTSGLITSDGAGLITSDGAGLITSDGAGLITSDGAGLFGRNASSLTYIADSLDVPGTSVRLAAGVALTVSNSGAFQYLGNALPLITSDGAGLITSDGAGLITSDGAGLVSAGAGAASVIAQLGLGQNASSLLSERGSGLIGDHGSELTGGGSGAFVTTAAKTLTSARAQFVGPQVRTSTATASSSSSDLASTPQGAALDAMLYADVMTRHEMELIEAGRPTSEAKPRGDDALAALNAAAAALKLGFAGLTTDQLAALKRSGSVILMNVAPATAGGTVAPGSDVVLTPVNPADSLAAFAEDVTPGQGPSVSLGGSVVTIGGTPASPLQPGGPLSVVPLNGSPMYLRSATPGKIVAQVPTFAASDTTQLILLTTADGRLAMGALNVFKSTGTLQFSAPTYSWSKNGGTANIIVTRTGGNTGALGAMFSTSDATAKAGIDYTSVSGTLFFADGDNHPRVISIPLLAGDGSNGDRTFNVSLSDPFNGGTLGTQASATLTLHDALGSVQGKVFNDPSGGARQPGDQGLANVVVYLDLNNDGVLNNSKSGDNVADLNATEPFTVTDAEGNYAFGALEPGSYAVRVVVPNRRTEAFSTSPTITVDQSGSAITGHDFGLAPPAPGSPTSPTLTPTSHTGVSTTDGLTRWNGSANAPLSFTVSESPAQNDFYRVFDVTDPEHPILIAGPIQATNNAITVSGNALSDGVHEIAVTTAVSADGPQSALSASTTITVQSSLKVLSVTPGGGILTGLPANKVVITFNHPIFGLNADDSTGNGFASNPSAVTLIPRGPRGAFAAPTALNVGSMPVPATLVYHVNADGTSTITLIAQQSLSTDFYRVVVASSLKDQAGNSVQGANGPLGPYQSQFEVRPTGPSGPLKVLAVTTRGNSVNLGYHTSARPVTIAQPDTLAIAFNKPLDILTVTTATVHLLAGPKQTPVQSAVAYSPTNHTVYLTPEARLVPGVTYTIRVDGTGKANSSVTDDHSFPNRGTPLLAPYSTSFRVKTQPAGPGTGPFSVLAKNGHLLTSPAFGPARASAFGYAAVPFAGALNPATLNWSTASLTFAAGGLNNTAIDSADKPLNVQMAFNPNVNTLIIVPTMPVASGTYQYVFNGLKSTNGKLLTRAGKVVPVKDTFIVKLKSSAH